MLNDSPVRRRVSVLNAADQELRWAISWVRAARPALVRLMLGSALGRDPTLQAACYRLTD
jgi:hypothetical protein